MKDGWALTFCGVICVEVGSVLGTIEQNIFCFHSQKYEDTTSFGKYTPANTLFEFGGYFYYMFNPVFDNDGKLDCFVLTTLRGGGSDVDSFITFKPE